MPTGDPYWGNQWSSATSNITWTYADNSSGGWQPAPFVAVPVEPVLAPPTDDSPLAWLRAQVAEITDLATAA